MIALAEALTQASARFDAVGIASGRFDAELLAAHVLDVERSAIAGLTVLGSRLDDEQQARFDELVLRRERREPVQHIIGSAAFRRIELAVGPGVFVPRPETEVVVGYAIDALVADGESKAANAHPIVVDLCSGSGAIAISVAFEVPAAQVHAVELSDDAVLWLARNVEECGVRRNVTVHHGDAVGFAPSELVGTVDVVVSNPPYVPLGADIRDPEVVVHDPALALWGGADGLDVVRGIVATARGLLKPGGLLVMEHGDLQGEDVPRVVEADAPTAASPHAWLQVRDHDDLSGRPRFTTAQFGTANV